VTPHLVINARHFGETIIFRLKHLPAARTRKWQETQKGRLDNAKQFAQFNLVADFGIP
jgi:hypothetical protein